MQRERLGSRIGFILLSAGCAIGIGNVWKFPYMAGQYGGGFFVLIYLAFLLIMGIPVMTMEFSLGRASQRSIISMYDELTPKKAWKAHSWASLAGNYLLMMFYTAVTGWFVQYFVKTGLGAFSGLNPEGVSEMYGQMMGNPVEMMIYTFIVIILGFFVCSFSLQKGLERVTKIMMTALIVIMFGLAINSFFLDGAAEGLSFYLKPDFQKMKEIGIGNVIVGAMNQAFFTLSLGIGSMAIFGSYLKKDRALMGESINVAVLDTVVALTSGLIIFPACFTYGVEVNAGPPLIFETLPNIFNNLPGGRIIGTLFFLFLVFAAFSTVLAVFENIIACCMDKFGWSRKKACLINCLAMLVLCLPCILGFNVLSGIAPLGEGTVIMDAEDFIVSNILLPLGSLVMVLFCTLRKGGWGWQKFTEEANTGKGAKVKNWMRFYCTYILPVIIFVFFVIGVINFFK